MSSAKTGPAIARGQSAQDLGTPWAFIHAVEAQWGDIAWDLAATSQNSKAHYTGNLGGASARRKQPTVLASSCSPALLLTPTGGGSMLRRSLPATPSSPA